MKQRMRPSPLGLTILSLLHYQPLHPYGIQRLIRQWGKDEVVNVEQRTVVYRAIQRLSDAGLIRPVGTSREQRYPERTVYEVTDAGRETAHQWMYDMLAAPHREFPQFPAALSNLLLFSREQMAAALERRAELLRERRKVVAAGLTRGRDQGLPRVAALDGEYTRAMIGAELKWVQGVLADLRSGSLSWSEQALKAIAEQLNDELEA